MKKYSKHLLFLLAAVVLLVYIESITPSPINWEPSFSRAEKIPFGSYVLYDQLPEIVRDPTPLLITTPFFLFFTEYKPDSLANLIFINRELSLDEFEVSFLLNFADSGGTVFLAASQFPKPLRDSLEIETTLTPFFTSDTLQYSLVNPLIGVDSVFSPGRSILDQFFTKFDTANAVVLGQNQSGKTNYLLYPYGRGRILLHSSPFAFTNYFFMESAMRPYILGALSYIPAGRTAWDEYHKIGRETASTPIRFILSRPGLKKAYALAVIGLIIFLLLNSKRRQRMIPVILPPRNLSLEFVRTVGRLYYINRDHRNLALKKINHFLEHLRLRYLVRTESLDASTIEQVARRTGIGQDDIQRLIGHITHIRQAKQIGIDPLKKLNQQIEDFYEKTGE